VTGSTAPLTISLCCTGLRLVQDVAYYSGTVPVRLLRWTQSLLSLHNVHLNETKSKLWKCAEEHLDCQCTTSLEGLEQ
jgi:hypothetical protein